MPFVARIGGEYEGVNCQRCGAILPFQSDEAILISPQRFTAPCHQCNTTGEYSTKDLRSIRFDGRRFLMTPSRGQPDSRLDSVLCLQLMEVHGDALYKYVRPERLDVLENELIRFTPPKECNDTAECLLRLSESAIRTFLREKMMRLAREKSQELLATGWFRFHAADGDENEERALARFFFETWERGNPGPYGHIDFRLREEIGLLSLTRLPHNPAMWAHYADDHRGLVIGFYGKSLVRQGQFWHLGGAWPIIYYKPAEKLEALDAPAFFYEKTEDWSWQQEWRVVRFLKEAASVRSPNIHLFPMPAHNVREVIVGYKADPDLSQRVLMLAESDPRYVHLRVLQAELGQDGAIFTRELRAGSIPR